jgi:hypothetical protein
MPHKTAGLTLEPQHLLLSNFSKLPLPRKLLPTIPLLLLKFMGSLALSQSSPFPSLIQGNSVSLMRLTLGAVCGDFFWYVHSDHRLVKYKTAPLITIYLFLERNLNSHQKKPHRINLMRKMA